MTTRPLRTRGAAYLPVLTLLHLFASPATHAQRPGTPLTGGLGVKLAAASPVHTMGADSIIPFTLDTAAKRFEATGTIPFTMKLPSGCEGTARLKVTLSGPVRGNAIVISTRSLELAPFALNSRCPQQMNLTPDIQRNAPDIVLGLDPDATGTGSWSMGPVTITLTYRWADLRGVPGPARIADVAPVMPAGPDPPDTTPIDTISPFAPRARNPLNVRGAPDRRRATSALIPVGGGTLSTTGADGTRFTLTVPANALLEATTLTLMPVTGIGGLPLSGGLAAAAQMEPEGLQLREPATLTIETPQPVPVAQRVSFAWYGLGEDFHLYPLQPDPDKLRLQVYHFSGTGVGRGTNADRAAQVLRVPVRNSAWFFQWSAQIQNAIARGDRPMDQGTAILVAIGRRYYETVLRPRMLLALTDAREMGVFSDANSWRKSLELLGQGGKIAKESAEIDDLYPKALRNAFDTAYDRCMTQHDLAAMPLIFAWARALSFIGIDVMDRIDDCFQFELVLDSKIGKTDPVTTNSVQVRARIPLEAPVGGEYRVVGTGPLELLAVSATFTGCQTTTVTRLPEGGETTPSVSFTLDVDTTGVQPPRLTGISMLILGSKGADGRMTQVCGSGSASVPMPSPYWVLFRVLHPSERDAAVEIGFRIENWEILGGALFARKQYASPLNIGGMRLTEQTTFELRHTPKP